MKNKQEAPSVSTDVDTPVLSHEDVTDEERKVLDTLDAEIGRIKARRIESTDVGAQDKTSAGKALDDV